MLINQHSRNRELLSPAQSLYFAMGRGLIVFSSWNLANEDAPIEYDKAVLFDFVLQYPKVVERILPDLSPIIRGHGLHKNDIGDSFAHRKYTNIREEFTEVVSGLLSRGLIIELVDNDSFSSTAYQITQIGESIAMYYSSSLSMAYKSICEKLSISWKRKNNNSLATEIRNQMRGNFELVGDLTKPFYPWISETISE